jgi:hypothetical protein
MVHIMIWEPASVCEPTLSFSQPSPLLVGGSDFSPCESALSTFNVITVLNWMRGIVKSVQNEFERRLCDMAKVVMNSKSKTRNRVM